LLRNVLYLRRPTRWPSSLIAIQTYSTQMKKTFSLVLSLFVAAFCVASCDDLTTIEIPFGITTEHHLLVAGNDAAIDIDSTIDLTTNADFNKHKNDISGVGIDSVAIMITDQIGAQTLNGNLMVDAIGGTSPVVLAAISKDLVQLQTETAGGVWQTLPTTAEGREKLAGLIKNSPHSGRIILRGMASNTPVNFQAHFKIFWAMKATEELI
jgi:hypothetical protein